MEHTKNKKRRFVLALIGVGYVGCAVYLMNNRVHKQREAFKQADISEFEWQKEHAVVDIIDEEMIREISERYGFEDADGIEKLTYIPLNPEQRQLDTGKTKEDYYIVHSDAAEMMDELVFSSWYEAVGGERRMEEVFEAEYEFQNVNAISGGGEVLMNALAEHYQLDSLEMSPVLKKYSVEVQEGCKKNLKAYLYQVAYDYEVREKNFWKDKEIGDGTLKRPCGIMVISGKDVKLTEL